MDAVDHTFPADNPPIPVHCSSGDRMATYIDIRISLGTSMARTQSSGIPYIRQWALRRIQFIYLHDLEHHVDIIGSTT